MKRKHQPVLEHYCFDPLTCGQCIHRFFVWAENYSNREVRPRKRRPAASHIDLKLAFDMP